MSRSSVSTALITAALLLVATSIYAQTNPGGTADPELSSGFGKKANYDQLQGHQHGSMAFVGKVAVVGGPLPWDPIPVVVLCNGQTRYNTRADLKGLFRIEAEAASSEVAPGAPNAKRMVPADLIGCNVRAALEGFSSSAVTIANRNMLDDPNIGTITLKREDTSAGAAVSTTTASAPKDATKAFEKARTELLDGKADRAQKDLEKAVQVYPQFAEAWYQLGRIQEVSKKGDAEGSYTKAIAADPKFVLPYQQLAPMAAQAGKWKELVEYTSHELELNPRGNPQTWYYNALGNVKTGKMDVAEVSAEKALAMDPLHTAPNTEQLLAVILVSKRDYAGALKHLRSSLTYVPPGPNADVIKQQVAQLEPMVETPK